MVRFYNNMIVVTKGDTIRKKIEVIDNDGSIYEVQPLDVINFGLKEKYTDEECLIETTIDNETLELLVLHEDTELLEVGKVYVYDIQITKENGDVLTFISGKLRVTNEVYSK